MRKAAESFGEEIDIRGDILQKIKRRAAQQVFEAKQQAQEAAARYVPPGPEGFADVWGPPPAPAMPVIPPPPGPPVAPLAGVIIPPIVPAGAVLAVPPGPFLGVAPAVNVSTHRVFATSWRGLTAASVDIVLAHGSIRVDGHSATIRVTHSGRSARGDIARITKFIKKRFKLGGYLGGIKMTSQRLIKYIIGHLPGTFAITR